MENGVGVKVSSLGRGSGGGVERDTAYPALVPVGYRPNKFVARKRNDKTPPGKIPAAFYSGEGACKPDTGQVSS